MKDLKYKTAKFVAVIYEDKQGDQINRQDYTPDEIADLVKEDKIEITIEC